MKELLDELPDGVVVVGADAVIRLMNSAAERLTGWLRADAIGRSFGDVMPLMDAAGFLVHEREGAFAPPLRMTSGTPERDYLLKHADGTERWVAVRASYERDSRGRLDQIVVSLRDIGRRRRLERARADLVATVAHEIRSPLTSVKGFTSTLLHRWDRFSDEQKRVMLETVNHDADRVTRLLTDLLDVSRLEAGRLELRRQEIDVASISTEVVARLRKRDEAGEHVLETLFPDEFPVLLADPGKIEQVITNLTENAIKYAAPGRVLISGTDMGEYALLRISDEGDGIDPRHLPHIFTKFYRRGAGERHSGTGLGLYICKGIVEAHGGHIWVERSGPEGTTFAFTLPKEAA
ncbi:MAG: ATP-binding protein [Actinomycetota bacterium]|nr:PAS domain-containing protein [Actinomycetota bacterium]